MNSSILNTDRRRFEAWLGSLRSSLQAGLEHEEVDVFGEPEGDLESHRQLDRILGEVSAALERLDSGQFGSCEDCGGAIGRDRLRSVPCSRTCIRCARRRREPALAGGESSWM